MEDLLSKNLILLCVASTRSSRTGAFGDGREPLDDAGKRAAEAFLLEDRFRDYLAASPARSAMETATAIGRAARKEAALRDMDHGRWAGRTFEEVHRESPDALAAWMAAPMRGAPEGETMEAVKRRVGDWLDAIRVVDTPLFAITHPMVIRAALSHALDLPVDRTLSIDIAPLARVRLSFNRIWRLQAIEP